MVYDVIIIGGGPAGVAAAVYTARKQLKTLLLTDSFGGQSIVSADIQNWIGEPHISGFDLAQKLEEHARNYPEMAEVKIPERVTAVKLVDCTSDGAVCDYEVLTESGAAYQGHALILAAGARRKKLGIPGEQQFDGKGVAYCSTCDAPMFGGKRVAVIGGGNAGIEAVRDLLPFASELYVLEYSDSLKADSQTVAEIKENLKLQMTLLNTQVLEITGDRFVNGLKYKNLLSGEEKTLPIEGIFIEIGSVPNTEMVKGLVELNAFGEIVTDAKTAATSRKGIFAAGDITDGLYKQNNIAVGDAVKAALSAYEYVLERKRHDHAAIPQAVRGG